MKKGFTFIELLLVIAMIGVLAVVILIFINPLEQARKTSDAKRKSDLSQIKTALDTYYADFGRYPASSADFKIAPSTTINWGDKFIVTGQVYMGKLPVDPTNPQRKYVYFSPAASNGQTYYLYANLERGGNDPQACTDDGGSCASFVTNGLIPINLCGGVCNYGISSPNVTP